MNSFQFNVPLCGGAANGTRGLYGDFSAPSQFYVFVGVMAFLYSLAAVVLYVCFDDKYRKYDQIPIAVCLCYNDTLHILMFDPWSGLAKPV